MAKMKNLLEKKLEMMKLPFYCKATPKNRRSAKTLKDHETYRNLEIEIQKQWLKNPNWIMTGNCPYTLNKKNLPVKGTKVKFILFDKVKDKKATFGFNLVNYRVEEGTYYGATARIGKGDYDRSYTTIKVLKDGYIYPMSPEAVIVAGK